MVATGVTKKIPDAQRRSSAFLSHQRKGRVRGDRQDSRGKRQQQDRQTTRLGLGAEEGGGGDKHA